MVAISRSKALVLRIKDANLNVSASGKGSDGGAVHIRSHNPNYYPENTKNTATAGLVSLNAGTTINISGGSDDGFSGDSAGTVTINGDAVSIANKIITSPSSRIQPTVFIGSSNLRISDGDGSQYTSQGKNTPTNIIYEKYLEKLSSDGINVYLRSANDLKIQKLSDHTLNESKGSLSLESTRGGILAASGTDISSTSGSLILSAATDITAHDISSNTGFIRIESKDKGNITLHNVTAGLSKAEIDRLDALPADETLEGKELFFSTYNTINNAVELPFVGQVTINNGYNYDDDKVTPTAGNIKIHNLYANGKGPISAQVGSAGKLTINGEIFVTSLDIDHDAPIMSDAVVSLRSVGDMTFNGSRSTVHAVSTNGYATADFTIDSGSEGQNNTLTTSGNYRVVAEGLTNAISRLTVVSGGSIATNPDAPSSDMVTLANSYAPSNAYNTTTSSTLIHANDSISLGSISAESSAEMGNIIASASIQSNKPITLTTDNFAPIFARVNDTIKSKDSITSGLTSINLWVVKQ
jgi:hypothetical protein